MIELGDRAHIHLENEPQQILTEINTKVTEQQNEFGRIWNEILRELKRERVFLIDEQHLNKEQQKFVLDYFHDEVRSNIVPLMIESMQAFPTLMISQFTWHVNFQNLMEAFRKSLHWYPFL